MKSKSRKITLGLVSGTMGMVSVVAPLSTLSSCSQSNDIQKIAFDDEYGVDDVSFQRLTLKFKAAFEESIKDKTVAQQEMKRELFEKDLEYFKTQLQTMKKDKQSSKSAYTYITTAMIDYAQRAYNLKLDRESKVQLNDVNKLYDGIKESWIINMRNSGMDKALIDEIMSRCQKQYNLMYQDWTESYKDPLLILLKAKSQMPMVFAAVNKELGLIGASLALKELTSKYTFVIKEGTDSAKLDLLMNAAAREDKETHEKCTFQVGQNISPFMDDLFTITNTITKNTVFFSHTNLLPGFEVTPKLNAIEIDPKTNQHLIKIDWECVKDVYTKSAQDRLDTTAHISGGMNFDLQNIPPEASLTDLIHQMKVGTINYSLPLSYENEKANLLNTYFNSSKNDQDATNVTFKWDNTIDPETQKPNACCDPFYSGKLLYEENGVRHYSIDESGLAQSGLMIQVEGEEAIRLDQAINGANENDDAVDLTKPIGPKTLEFLKNATIASDCTIQENETGPDTIYNKIYVRYNNSTYNEPEQKVYVTEAIDTTGFPISRNMYWNATNKVNVLVRYVKTYSDNAFKDQLIDAQKAEKEHGIYYGISLATDALFIGMFCVPMMRPESKILLAIYISLSAADAILASAEFGLFTDQFKNKVERYANKTADFAKTEICQKAVRYVNKDARNINILTCDKYGNINEQEYQDNYLDHFAKETDFDDLLEIVEKYSTSKEFAKSIWNQKEIIDFEAEIDGKDISMDNFNKDMKEWEPEGSKTEAINQLRIWSSILLGLQLVIGIGDMIYSIYHYVSLLKFQKKIAAIVYANAAIDGERETAALGKKLVDKYARSGRIQPPPEVGTSEVAQAAKYPKFAGPQENLTRIPDRQAFIKDQFTYELGIDFDNMQYYSLPTEARYGEQITNEEFFSDKYMYDRMLVVMGPKEGTSLARELPTMPMYKGFDALKQKIFSAIKFKEPGMDELVWNIFKEYLVRNTTKKVESASFLGTIPVDVATTTLATGEKVITGIEKNLGEYLYEILITQNYDLLLDVYEQAFKFWGVEEQIAGEITKQAISYADIEEINDIIIASLYQTFYKYINQPKMGAVVRLLGA